MICTSKAALLLYFISNGTERRAYVLQQTQTHPARLCLLTYAEVPSSLAPIVVTSILHVCGRLRRLLHPKATSLPPLCGRAQGVSRLGLTLFCRLSAQYC
jgi:hypothetical protein